MAETWEDLVFDSIAETGLPEDVLEELFQEHCGPNTPIPTLNVLVNLLMSYKLSSTERVLARILRKNVAFQ